MFSIFGFKIPCHLHLTNPFRNKFVRSCISGENRVGLLVGRQGIKDLLCMSGISKWSKVTHKFSYNWNNTKHQKLTIFHSYLWPQFTLKITSNMISVVKCTNASNGTLLCKQEIIYQKIIFIFIGHVYCQKRKRTCLCNTGRKYRKWGYSTTFI